MNLPSLVMVAMSLAVAVTAEAQPASIGRQPVLAPLSGDAVQCRQAAANRQLAARGIARVLAVVDSVHRRHFAAGLDARGRLRYFDAFISEAHGRRAETEHASLIFSPTGQIASGKRRAFTSGTPSRLDEDRSADLLAGDSAAAQRLAKTLIERCRF